MNQSTNQFRLDVRLENQPPMKIDVVDSISVGLDPRNDLVLLGNKIKNRQLLFEKKGENLALHYLGNTNQTFLNSLPLEENKIYLLEPGDRIQLTGAEIIIRSELVLVHETQKVKSVIFNPEPMIAPIINSDKENVIQDTPTLPPELAKRRPQAQPPVVKKMERGPLLNLWAIKFYSLVVDAFITYLILVVALPLIFVDHFALAITNYLASLIFPHNTHSFFSFFIAWYLLSFSQMLVFGTTIGQFLLGLRISSNPTFGKLILYRMKTFFFSLFLIPAQNVVKNNLFFKGIRKVGMIIILIFILVSPFLLPTPYNSNLTAISNEQKGLKELHTRTIMSYSKELQMSLSAELPFRYYLMPTITNLSKRAFQIVDLKTGDSMMISEVDDMSYEIFEDQLKYGNPLYSTLHKSSVIGSTLKEKKALVESVLLLSPINLAKSAKTLGPFFGSGILVKEALMNGNLKNDMVLRTYMPETPVLYLSSTQQDFFYLLDPVRMRRFVVDSTNRGNLLTVFEQSVITKLNQDSNNPLTPNHQNVTILEAQDAFLHGDEQTFLTYYVGIANSLSNVKIIHAEVDLTDKAKLAVIRNIEAVQKFIKNKNVYKSFNDIKNQLAPMEKPGEKR
jgi:hypothetical protein